MTEKLLSDEQQPNTAFDYESVIEAAPERSSSVAPKERSRTESPAPHTLQRKGGICHWLMENHQLLSSISVIIGLPTTVLALVLTMNQMKSSKVNFEEEMAMQRRSTAAVLFNDFLKDVRALQTGPSINNLPPAQQKEAKKLLAVQAEFMLSGIGDTHIRSKLFRFLANEYGDEFLAGTPIPIVKTRGLSFENGNVHGSFRKVLFEDMSFAGASINGQFEKGFIRYTDFSNVLFNNLKMEKTSISCTSMAGAVLSGASPSLSGTKLSYVDLRGVSVRNFALSDNGHAAALAAILNAAERLHEVRLDPPVERELQSLGRNIEYDTDSAAMTKQNPAQWFAKIKGNRYCEKRVVTNKTAQPSST